MPSSRSSSKPSLNWCFDAIGTSWQIELFEDTTGKSVEDLKQLIADRIESFDKTYSRFRADSDVTEWASHAGKYPLPADAIPLLAFYKRLYDVTGGAVTPLIGQSLSDAGYDAQYSLRPKQDISPVPARHDSFDFDNNEIHIKQPVLLDFGAAGKGYLVDIISQLVEAAGIGGYCINAGGDLYFKQQDQLLDIALENPDDYRQAVGVVTLPSGQALCGSAGNRRAWSGYNHILDPRSLQSPQHLKAVWVVTDSCMVADGLTTALYFAAPEILRQKFSFSYAVIHNDGSGFVSDNFPGEFFV